jgi:hypothetical protein
VGTPDWEEQITYGQFIEELETVAEQFASGKANVWVLWERNWPTQHQMWRFNAPGAADTILQILKGEGHYYGLGDIIKKPDVPFKYRDPWTPGVWRPYGQRGSKMIPVNELLKNGGRALVVGSTMNKGWESYRSHPQLTFWTGDRAEISRNLQNGNNLPVNTRVVIVSRFISHAEADKINNEARRKNCVIYRQQNDGQITDLLEEMCGRKSVPPTPVEVPKLPAVPAPLLRPFKRGEAQEFLTKYHQSELRTPDEARRLGVIAKDLGFEIDPENMRQNVWRFRNAAGYGKKEGTADHVEQVEGRITRTTTKVSVKPADMDQTAELLSMINQFQQDINAAFDMLRDQVGRMHKENLKYREIERLMDQD